ncbi:transposase [Actinoplanes sp. NBC_00393]|uniref:transposase n=1 Tax=Actinoplanes sp. NBC_00393 TaxID=2975953 RepID=UPI002E2447F5
MISVAGAREVQQGLWSIATLEPLRAKGWTYRSRRPVLLVLAGSSPFFDLNGREFDSEADALRLLEARINGDVFDGRWACPVLMDIQDQGTWVSGRMSSIMESVGKKRSRPRRAFTPEFKAEIVELCQRGDRTVGQVARDFDLTETAVRSWVKQAELDAGTRTDGLTSDERTELARLRSENRRLQQDVDILKRATAFFARETR